MLKEYKQKTTIPMQNLTNEELVSACITDIQWERIIMHLTLKVYISSRIEEFGFDKNAPLDFYLVTAYNKANAIFKAEKTDEDTYVISLNVTNPSYCDCVPTGTYSIQVCQNDSILCSPVIDGALCPMLPDKSRNFLHNNKTKGYNVNFSVSEEEEALFPVITIADMNRCGLPIFNEETRTDMKPTFRKKYNKTLNQYRHKVIRFLYRFFLGWYGLFKPSKKTVLFMSEQSETLGTNLTSVMNRMHERGLDKDYEIITSARATVAVPHYGIKSWTVLMRKMAKAEMIFLDDHAPVLDWLVLDDSRVTLVQLWHAGAGFKSSGYSRWGHPGCPAPVSCHRQYKFGIAGSRHIAHFFSEVFGINTEQVLPTGMPRMDEFLDPEYRAAKTMELYEKFPIALNKKVLLFAPTYRGKNRADAHYPYELIDFERMAEWCRSKGWVVLFKMHPWVASAVPIPEGCKDVMADVNKYPNINDMFYITNLLITDYSSNIFEYSLMRQPALFFAFDEIQYAFSRGFHRDYESSAPGKVCHTFDEVMTALETEDFDYEKIEEYARVHFDYTDSGASDRVIDWILLGQLPEITVQELKHIDAVNQRLKDIDFSALDPVEESDDDDEQQVNDTDPTAN